MSRQSLLRRLSALAVVPLLLAASGGPDWTLYRCRMDHRTRLSPCCPDEDQAASATDRAIGTNDDGCCDATTIHTIRLPFERSANAAHAVLPALALAPAPLAPTPLVPVLWPGAETAWVDTGPPVFLKVRSLLI